MLSFLSCFCFNPSFNCFVLQSQASELIELFDNLIETEVSFIAPYVKDVVMFLLQVSFRLLMDLYFGFLRKILLTLLNCALCLRACRKDARLILTYG